MLQSQLTERFAFGLALFLASVIAPPALADSTGDATREFPSATVITGTPKDRGLAYGKEFREAIRDFLDKEIFTPFVGKPASKEQMLRYAEACGKVVRDECPMIAEEFQGIADGAGLTFDEVVLINLHEELYHRTELPKQGHCTAVAVAPPDTGNKHTYVGQTWDWMQSVAGKSRVTEWRRDQGASVLAYGFPGMPMGAGLSSEGIALCWTSAALGNKSLSPRVGIPSYVLIAHLLAQQDLDSVIREARKSKHAGWFTFVIADGAGRLANIEGSPERVVVEQPKDRLVRVDYGSSELGTKTEQQVRLHPRCQHLYDLLQASRGKNDLARLQNYLDDPGCKINVGNRTIDMMVFDTTDRSAYLSRGTSYKLAWRKFEFGAKK
jgi:isopenicillin-N N-acyltransferase-like protein